MSAAHKLNLPILDERPQTRADCLPGGFNEQRPCGYVSCKFHLLIAATSRNTRKPGQITWHPILGDREPESLNDYEFAALLMAMPATCVLDVAEMPREQPEIAEVMGLTRQATLATEDRAVQKLNVSSRVKKMLGDWK
jgi:hypothetical protein